jgi:hypothetical protein
MKMVSYTEAEICPLEISEIYEGKCEVIYEVCDHEEGTGGFFDGLTLTVISSTIHHPTPYDKHIHRSGS